MALSSSAFPGLGIFNATFHQPAPPLVATELSGIFIQHKWSNTHSHIVSGYWYNSATARKVRVDETYSGGSFGSSLFDYTNISQNGQTMNHQIIYAPNAATPPTCFHDYIDTPGFPLVTTDILQQHDAVFGGVVTDPLLGGMETETWHVLLAPSLPVTVYLDDRTPPVLAGYDFWSPNDRTKVVTRFFAHEAGDEIGRKVFEEFGCPGEGHGDTGVERGGKESDEGWVRSEM